MTIESEAFVSPMHLAEFSTGSTAVFFVVGAEEACSLLLDELSGLVKTDEKIVRVPSDARIFHEMELPKSLPALGVWSAKGRLWAILRKVRRP